MSDFMIIQDTYRGFTTLLRHHYRGGHSYVVLKDEKEVLSSGPQPYGIEQAIHAMHRHIDRWIELDGVDAETGSRYTIKVYESFKVEDEEGWRHSRIELSPNSDDESFNPIILNDDEVLSYRVVGEFVCVI